MPGYDSWKTRSPDDDLSGLEPTQEQQRVDWEDQMQRESHDCHCGGDCTGAPEGPMHNCPYHANLQDGELCQACGCRGNGEA
jgi:hypothetical protein